MEHTKGKVEVRYNMILSKGKNDFTIASVGTIGIPKTESDANLSLIADAFNTTNESGLTPSQLYKQNQELLEALKKSKDKISELFTKGVDFAKINSELFTILEQAINNAKTK